MSSKEASDFSELGFAVHLERKFEHWYAHYAI